VHILGIAATCLALAERYGEARAVAASIRGVLPRYGVGDLLEAFRFRPDAAALFRPGAQRRLT
jgi:hypothetical protein